MAIIQDSLVKCRGFCEQNNRLLGQRFGIPKESARSVYGATITKLNLDMLTDKMKSVDVKKLGNDIFKRQRAIFGQGAFKSRNKIINVTNMMRKSESVFFLPAKKSCLTSPVSKDKPKLSIYLGGEPKTMPQSTKNLLNSSGLAVNIHKISSFVPETASKRKHKITLRNINEFNKLDQKSFCEPFVYNKPSILDSYLRPITASK